MSGNPDVLEYYRNKCSRKPIRTIDLQECEVHVHCGETQHQRQQTPQPLQKRPFQNQHLFVVKTAARVFYLLAKTQEEMNSWVQSISQICTFGTPDDTGEIRHRLVDGHKQSMLHINKSYFVA